MLREILLSLAKNNVKRLTCQIIRIIISNLRLTLKQRELFGFAYLNNHLSHGKCLLRDEM